MKIMKALFVLLLTSSAIAAQALPLQVVFHVSLGQASATSVSGRPLVFAKPLGPADKRPVAAVNMDQIDTHATAIAAQEVAHLEPGATVELDADVTAFPTPFSQLKPGRYAVQAVLDRDHSYNYTGRGPGCAKTVRRCRDSSSQALPWRARVWRADSATCGIIKGSMAAAVFRYNGIR